MSRSPSWIVPDVGVSSPATIRSVVVLPQPDGPSRAKNEPLGTSRSRSSTAVKVAELLGQTAQLAGPSNGCVTVRRRAASMCLSHL